MFARKVPMPPNAGRMQQGRQHWNVVCFYWQEMDPYYHSQPPRAVYWVGQVYGERGEGTGYANTTTDFDEAMDLYEAEYPGYVDGLTSDILAKELRKLRLS